MRPTHIRDYKMKRITLILFVMLCYMAPLKAQTTFVGNYSCVPYNIYSIPGDFTSNGHSNIVTKTYNNGNYTYRIYDNDFVTNIFTFDNTNLYCGYVDFSSAATNRTDGCGALLFTQNLFNSDDHYEYVDQFETGWNIKSTNGSVIQTINTSDGYRAGDICIMHLDGMYYLGLYEWQGDVENGEMLIYRIETNQGLTKVETPLPLSVFPTMPTREEQITVELGEGTNATEITVVNGLGQVVKRVPVEEGQRTITIPANELGSGLNVVNARSNQGQGSCKIIVK